MTTKNGRDTGKGQGGDGAWKAMLASRRFLLCLIVVEPAVLLIVLYAIASGAEISSGPGKWFSIGEANKRKLGQLQNEFEEFRKKYTSMETELKQRIADLEKTTINIGMLPERIKAGDPNAVVRNIRNLVEEIDRLQHDVSFSLAVVSREITTNGTINTNQPTTDVVKRLNCHIQRCLLAIGCYESNITGEREDTHNAVVRFQQRRGLSGDGLIGRKTWAAIMAAFERVREEG